MFETAKKTAIEIALRGLLAAFRTIMLELLGKAMENRAVAEVNAHLDAASAALDSDGDGVPDAIDAAPFDARIRNIVRAEIAAANGVISQPAAQGPGVGSHPAFSGTAEAVDNASVPQ